MENPFKSEKDIYPNIAELIESGGKIEIGKDRHFSSLIRIIYDREIIVEVDSPHIDLCKGLAKADAKLEKWIESNW